MNAWDHRWSWIRESSRESNLKSAQHFKWQKQERQSSEIKEVWEWRSEWDCRLSFLGCETVTLKAFIPDLFASNWRSMWCTTTQWLFAFVRENLPHSQAWPAYDLWMLAMRIFWVQVMWRKMPSLAWPLFRGNSATSSVPSCFRHSNSCGSRFHGSRIRAVANVENLCWAHFRSFFDIKIVKIQGSSFEGRILGLIAFGS